MKRIQQILPFVAIILTLSLIACNSKSGSKSTTVKPEVDLNTAVFTGNVDQVKANIDAGVDLNSKEPMGGSTPLITAAAFGKTEVAQLLIDAGANLNLTNNEGSTALLSASFFCYPEIVKMLLKAGADKSISNKYGQNAYQVVAANFEDVKPVYQAFEKMFQPMGITFDYAHLEKTRPVIAEMLKE